MTESTNTPVIKLKNVGYYYQKRKGFFSKEKFWALKQVTFTLHKGESLVIIGRNGAGKSTLLRLLAGIISPDRGTLQNFGFTASLLSLQAGFLPYLTGRENTLLNGMILGLKKQIILNKMDKIHSFSGLDSFFDQPIQAYSSGMKARLGFSIAFQLDPDIFLLDEVLGVGDETFREKSTKKMKEKIISNQTVVLVSHSSGTIKELCNRAVWVEDGISRAEGNAIDVISDYNTYIKHHFYRK